MGARRGGGVVVFEAPATCADSAQVRHEGGRKVAREIEQFHPRRHQLRRIPCHVPAGRPVRPKGHPCEREPMIRLIINLLAEASE